MTTSSRVLYLNSKDRQSGNAHDYSVDTTALTDSFFQIKENEKLLVKVQSFYVLNDYNNISNLNRTFQLLLEDSSANVTTYTVSCDIGIYNSFTFQTEIQNQIQSVLTSNSLPLSISVTLDEDTLKYIYTFTSTDPNYFDNNEITFNFDDVETSLAQFMGFRAFEYGSISFGGDTLVLESADPIDFVFQPEIQVHCSLVSNNYESSSSGTKASDILFTTYSQTKNSWIEYINQSNAFETECNNQFGSIEIRYTDNLGRPILFQSDSRLTLSFRKVKTSNEETSQKIVEALNNILDVNKLTALGLYLGQQ